MRTGGETTQTSWKVHAAMELFMLLFVLLLALASVFGLTADTRDATGRPPVDGGREWRSRT